MKTRLLFTVMSGVLATLAFGCGEDDFYDEDDIEIASTSSGLLCYPDWVLVSNRNPICHIDKDRHLLNYDLEFYTEDSYTDRNRCYSGTRYKKRKEYEISCSWGVSESTCIAWSGRTGPPVNRDQCTGARLNYNPVCSTDADCEDGLYCTGQEYCDQGACKHRNRPCRTVDMACDEYRDRCYSTCGGTTGNICR